MNKVMLLGNLTRDPELSLVGTSALAKFGIAVNERFKSKEGDKKERTHFFDVEAWGPTAEFADKYFKKGTRCVLVGSLKQDTWEAEGQKRSKVFIRADELHFGDSKPQDSGSSETAKPVTAAPTTTRRPAGRPAGKPAAPVQQPKAEPEGDFGPLDDVPF